MTAPTGDMGALKAILGEVATGRPLTEAEAETAFGIIMSGNATPSQMGGLLMALRVRGETVEEITAAARIMRARALPVVAPVDAIDIVGTGGDGAGTLNVSTAAALVVAACGVPVAKHGNKALSSRSGAADVLSALGVNIDAEPQALQRCLAEAGIAFLMAPRHHVATRHVAPTRGELGTRTIFNLLGPLTNPAGVRRHLIGVFAERWVTPLAEVLGRLGSERAWVVHSQDGLDEISLAGPTHVAALEAGTVRRFQVTPEDAGLARAPLGSVRGGDPAENAAALTALLGGAPGSYRDIVLFNAAAALIVAGAVTDLRAGVRRAAAALDDGSAAAVLQRLISASRGGAGAPAQAAAP